MPLLITASLSATASSNSFSLAQLDVRTFNEGFVIDEKTITVSTDPSFAHSFSGTFTLNAGSGDPESFVSLDSSVSLGTANTSVFETASAGVDPIIVVDPSFANAGAYSIVLTPGIGNGPTDTPEPHSGYLLSSGLFAGLVCVFRSRIRP